MSATLFKGATAVPCRLERSSTCEGKWITTPQTIDLSCEVTRLSGGLAEGEADVTQGCFEEVQGGRAITLMCGEQRLGLAEPRAGDCRYRWGPAARLKYHHWSPGLRAPQRPR